LITLTNAILTTDIANDMVDQMPKSTIAMHAEQTHSLQAQRIADIDTHLAEAKMRVAHLTAEAAMCSADAQMRAAILTADARIRAAEAHSSTADMAEAPQSLRKVAAIDVSPPRKRKAEEMISGKEATALSENNNANMGLGYLPARVKIQAAQLTKSTSNATQPKEAMIEPPACKRVKIMSYARPYLIGALAGGVGVITALVSLPESLF